MSASGVGVADRVAKLRLPLVRTTERQPNASRLLAASLMQIDTIEEVLMDNERALDPTRHFDPFVDTCHRGTPVCGSIGPIQEGAWRRYADSRGGERTR